MRGVIEMKHYLIFLLAILISSGLSGQQLSEGEKPIASILSEIEQESDFRFYYWQDWISGMTFEGNLNRSSISSTLDQLFNDSEINYFIDGNKIILLNKMSVDTLPAIAQVDVAESTASDAKIGLIFTREYESNSSNEEEKVSTVGDKSEFEIGQSITIVGYVTDKESNEPVEGVYLFIEKPFTGAVSGPDGFYSLTIPNGRQQIVIQSIQMKNTFRNIVGFSNGQLDIELLEDLHQLDEVVVDANAEANIQSTEMGLTRLGMEEVKNMPVLFGEKDIIKMAATTPGVQQVGEGSAGVNIRGGKADQNLFQLDGAPIYNTSHFFGFFSVVNTDVIDDMEIYKSGIPVQHGGRLSSVFDIHSKTFKKEKLSGKGGVGPVTSSIMLEGPISENTSFMIGGRGTYSNFVLDRVKSSFGNNDVRFYDAIGKLNYQGRKDQISVTGYYSFDSFRLNADTLLSFTDFSYSNSLVSVNWKHDFSNNLFSKLTAAFSKYDFHTGYDQLTTQAFGTDFSVEESMVNLTFDYLLKEGVNFNFGIVNRLIGINPGSKYPIGEGSLVLEDQVEKEQGVELAPFASLAYDFSSNISLYGGLRYSLYNVLGPMSEIRYEDGESVVASNRTDTVHHGKGEIVKVYAGIEPRISMRYLLNQSSSLKASYNRTRQNQHLLINAASIAPTDTWRLSSPHIKPQIADQISIGYYKNIYGKNTFEFISEIYYKDIQNLLDFKVGSNLQFNKHIETEVLQGDGRSYGFEVSVNKTNGWLTGWLNYTYSRSLMKFDGNTPIETINDGDYFPTGYDKPHYINSITNYKFTRRYSMSVNLVYSSGVPVTFPAGKWNMKGVENIYYSDRNQFRIPSYFRADIGLNIEGNHKIKKLGHSFWSFSVYNVLGRNNAYSIFFSVKDGEVEAYKLTVFPNPIPTVSYNFSF
ncbi:MAG: carboxypeptidase-like regulatory domain-containing protein [Cyclobacteriaceae bacterium]